MQEMSKEETVEFSNDIVNSCEFTEFVCQMISRTAGLIGLPVLCVLRSLQAISQEQESPAHRKGSTGRQRE